MSLYLRISLCREPRLALLLPHLQPKFEFMSASQPNFWINPHAYEDCWQNLSFETEVEAPKSNNAICIVNETKIIENAQDLTGRENMQEFKFKSG